MNRADAPHGASLPITINGDPCPEPDEAFFVDLLSAVNAMIGDGQGVGTIVNDD